MLRSAPAEPVHDRWQYGYFMRMHDNLPHDDPRFN